jgi:hypothetical protein
MKKNSQVEKTKLKFWNFLNSNSIQGANVQDQASLKTVVFSPIGSLGLVAPQRGLLKRRSIIEL